MADNTLDKTQKNFERKARTSDSRQPWQERLERWTSIAAQKQLQATEIISGMSGSWAAQVSYDPSVFVGTAAASLPPVLSAIRNHLGKPGMPEIYFRPYDFRTNRESVRGPSLIGHPVAFEVVGPTAKFYHNDWMWDYTAAAGGDELDLAGDRYDDGGSPDIVTSLEEAYGITAIPEGGLYVMISVTGERGTLDTVAGDAGLGDGLIDAVGYTPIVPSTVYARDINFEIFRVINFQSGATNKITLDPNKRIATFISAGDTIRSITLLKPAAARMQAIGGTGGGRGAETVFAFLPPSHSLNADLMPSYQEWHTDSQFCPWNNYAGGHTGEIADWNEGQAIPVPTPINKGEAALPASPVTVGVGRFRIDDTGTGPHTPVAGDVGRIVHIFEVDAASNAVLTGGSSGLVADPGVDRLIGWFEVVAVSAGTSMTLRRLPEMDPATGVPFYSPEDTWTVKSGGAVTVQYTLHEPISTIWTSDQFDIEVVQAARLQNLIDPSLVGTKTKIYSTDLPDGFTTDRADKAIFDTATSNSGASGSNADPGSMLDLGYRVVLFPAKDSTVSPGTTVPDFDNPIASRNVVLDPTETEEQYIDIDYSAGLITLSHIPVPGAGCDIAPNGIVNAGGDNPRGEIVLFASFIPYSQEEGQLGTGVRVTGQDQSISACDVDEGTYYTDVFGDRTTFPVLAGTTITSGLDQVIDLDVAYSSIALPPTGYVELVKGTSSNGEPIFTNGTNSAALFGYTRVTTSGGKIRLAGCWGGKDHSPADTYAVTAQAPVTAILRKEIWPPNPTGVAGTDYRQDTFYGFPYRASRLNFKDGEVTANRDGSVDVKIRDPRTQGTQEILGAVLSSWVLSGGVASDGGARTVDLTEIEVIAQGYKRTLAAQNYDVVTDDDHYVYIDATDPCSLSITSATTMPTTVGNEIILLARVTTAGGAVTEIIDLRYPMDDIDQRADILVGFNDGVSTAGSVPHFETLKEAVDYASEIMTPVAGTRGRYIKIKVVGFTNETGTITINTDGLIIEGAARRTDGTTPDFTAVRWSTEVPLIDFNGHSDIIFRDLTFEYAGSITSPTNPAAVVFTQTSTATTSQRLVIENCTAIGNPLHAFLYSPASPADGIENSVFRANRAENLTDFGFAFVSACNYLVIEGNTFDDNSNAIDTDIGGSGLVYSGGVALLAGNNLTRVVGNNLSGFQMGVVSAVGVAGVSEGLRIEGNFITATEEPGILLNGLYHREFFLCRNSLKSCHTQAASVLTTKTALYTIDSGAGASEGVIAENHLEVSGGVGTSLDSGIAATRVSHNHCQEDLSVAAATLQVVTGNFVSGSLYTGDGSVVNNNYIVTDLVLSGTASEDTYVSNNIILGQVSNDTGKTATSCTFIGNRVTGASSVESVGCLWKGNVFEADITFATVGFTRGVFQGNVIQNGILTFGAGVSESVVEGNEIRESNPTGFSIVATAGTNFFNSIANNVLAYGLDYDGTDSEIVGNTLYGAPTTGNWGMEVQGGNNRISNNSSERGMSIQEAENLVATGNMTGSSNSAAQSATVSAGGMGYNVGDRIAVAGGSGVEQAAVFEVATLTGSAIATVTLIDGGVYLSGGTPANPAATATLTGGGSSATLTVTYGTSKGEMQVAGGDNATITGNRIVWRFVATGSDNMTIQGNNIGVDDASDAASADNLDVEGCASPVIMGNRVYGHIYADTTQPTIVGNSCTAIRTAPASGAAAPADSVVVGNNTSGGGGGVIYNGVGAGATQTANNV